MIPQPPEPKIFIVDDDPLVRRALVRAFQSFTCKVIETGESTKVLDIWKSSRPDILLLDVLMPGLSGPQILAQADRNLKLSTKVVLMSAYSGVHNEVQEDRTVNLFLTKPFEDIFQTAESILRLVL